MDKILALQDGSKEPHEPNQLVVFLESDIAFLEKSGDRNGGYVLEETHMSWTGVDRTTVLVSVKPFGTASVSPTRNMVCSHTVSLSDGPRRILRL